LDLASYADALWGHQEEDNLRDEPKERLEASLDWAWIYSRDMWRVIGNSKGKGYLKSQTFQQKLKYEPKLEFPEEKEEGVYVNPLTPGIFCQKCILWTFWRFSGWIWAKLAPIYSERYLQHDSMPFFPLASCFMAFPPRHAQKSKF